MEEVQELNASAALQNVFALDPVQVVCELPSACDADLRPCTRDAGDRVV